MTDNIFDTGKIDSIMICTTYMLFFVQCKKEALERSSAARGKKQNLLITLKSIYEHFKLKKSDYF